MRDEHEHRHYEWNDVARQGLDRESIEPKH